MYELACSMDGLDVHHSLRFCAAVSKLPESVDPLPKPSTLQELLILPYPNYLHISVTAHSNKMILYRIYKIFDNC
jgi:hypothetical protein